VFPPIILSKNAQVTASSGKPRRVSRDQAAATRSPRFREQSETKILAAHRFGYLIDPKYDFFDRGKDPFSRWLQRMWPFAGCRCREQEQRSLRRCVMKKFLTVIALISLLTVPALESANAALVSPSSPAFGDNGY